MDQFDEEVVGATIRAKERLRSDPRAVAARYDRGQIIIDLSTGYQVSFAAVRAQGLAGAAPSDLAEIEITPSGYGLHWPKLDADLWLPALLEGVFGSRAWMAARLGAEGGKATSDAKAAAARENGKRGGRPKRAKARKAVKARKAKPAHVTRTREGKPKSKAATHMIIRARKRPATKRHQRGKARA
jgi:Protein of unknown function (DUF2442)